MIAVKPRRNQPGRSEPRTRVCCRFGANRVAASNGARLGAGRRQWSFPCQVLQRRLAPFAAQPEGTGRFCAQRCCSMAHLAR
ncbi:hypothetical protein F3I16_16215 [Pseudomonas sp. L-22-4S-12]|nr:hypothetical protein [Pseudomonas sp. L-22-4S-12]